MTGEIEKQQLNLMQFFEGFVKCYRKMNFSGNHNKSMFTKREIEFFTQLGEMLGFEVFIEDAKPTAIGRSRPMDLSWWKYDARIHDEHYTYLALHLERESLPTKARETIEKLFSMTDDAYTPHNVIGIQYVTSAETIDELNELVVQKNNVQQSNVMMVYRYEDDDAKLQKIRAFHITTDGILEERNAVLRQDVLGYYYMCFEEEYTILEGGQFCNEF